MIKFNPNSGDHLSVLFFGGYLKEDVRVPITDEDGNQVYTKKGDPKSKLIEQKVFIKGLGLTPLPKWILKKEGFYCTDEQVLQYIAKGFNKEASKIAELMLQIRNVSKQIRTYYEGVEKYIDPDTNLIHAHFSHINTDTRRTSCNKPNLQNQPKPEDSDVKKHFTSRFNGVDFKCKVCYGQGLEFRGCSVRQCKICMQNPEYFNNGKIVKADFSQIEICIQAEQSKDTNYINDVLNGIDFHIKHLAFSSGEQYDYLYNQIKVIKNEDFINARSKIKAFTFSEAYGGSDYAVSMSSGLSIEQVKKIKEEKEIAYPVMHKYYEDLYNEVKKNGCYKNMYNGIFHFQKRYYWNDNRQKVYDYRFPEVKNYVVQGTAADIALILLGKFWREKAIHNRDSYLLINFVHDEIDLDCKKKHVENLTKDLQLLNSWSILSKQMFNYDWKVPIKISVTNGASWYDCS